MDWQWVADIKTPLGVAGVALMVVYGIYRALIKGPLATRLGKGHVFKLINRIVTFLFILALVAVVLAFVVTPLMQALAKPSDSTPAVDVEHVERVLSFDKADASVLASRDLLDRNLNEEKTNLSHIGLEEDATSRRLAFYIQMARAFHDDPDSDHLKARPYAERATEIEPASELDRERAGAAHAIVASTYLFDYGMDLRARSARVIAAIQAGKALLDSVGDQARSPLWHKYRVLLGDYEAEYHFRKPNREPEQAARVCRQGLRQALPEGDRFGLDRYLYRSFKLSTSEIARSVAAARPVDGTWPELLLEALDAYPRYEALAGSEGKAVSERSSFAYLGALEIAMWPALAYSRWAGDRRAAYDELTSALRRHEPKAEEWGRQQRFALAATSRVYKGIWYARRLILAHALQLADEDYGRSWTLVREALAELEANPKLAGDFENRLSPVLDELAASSAEYAPRLAAYKSYSESLIGEE